MNRFGWIGLAAAVGCLWTVDACAAEGGIQFNSPLALRVWVLDEQGELRVVGATPSSEPVNIPTCRWWAVVPERGTTLAQLAVEARARAIPGVRLEGIGDGDLAVLKDWPGLRVVDLSGSGKITEAGLAHLKSVRQLEVLYLYLTPIGEAGWGHLKEVKQLRELHFWGNSLTDAGLAHVRKMPGLRELYVPGEAGLTDAGLVRLKGLKALETLDLSLTYITDAGLSHLSELESLRSLCLKDTEVGDAGLAALKNNRTLARLNLRRTRVGDAGVSHLKSLRALRWLDLGVTGVTDAGMAALGSMKELEFLELQRTAITDAGLAQLRSCRRLRTLRLWKTGVTDAGLAHLKDLGELRDLDLWQRPIGDAGLVHLAKLKKMEALNLDGTKITDAGLAHVAEMTQLRELHLGHTAVTDAGLRHLRTLRHLRRLRLGDTAVTDAGLAHLSGLTNLEYLNLARTKVTGAGLARLGQARLQELCLWQTSVSDTALPQLVQWQGMLLLDLRETQVSRKGIDDLRKALPNIEVVGQPAGGAGQGGLNAWVEGLVVGVKLEGTIPATQPAATRPGGQEPVRVAIAADETVSVAGRALSDEELGKLLQAAAKDDPRRAVFIRADRKVKWQRTVEVFNLAVKAGFTEVGLVPTGAADTQPAAREARGKRDFTGTVAMTLPPSGGRDLDTPPEPLRVVIEADETVTVGGQGVSDEELAGIFQSIAKAGDGRGVAIQPRPTVPWRRATEVLDLAVKAGVKHAGMAPTRMAPPGVKELTGPEANRATLAMWQEVGAKKGWFTLKVLEYGPGKGQEGSARTLLHLDTREGMFHRENLDNGVGITWEQAAKAVEYFITTNLLKRSFEEGNRRYAPGTVVLQTYRSAVLGPKELAALDAFLRGLFKDQPQAGAYRQAAPGLAKLAAAMPGARPSPGFVPIRFRDGAWQLYGGGYRTPQEDDKFLAAVRAAAGSPPAEIRIVDRETIAPDPLARMTVRLTVAGFHVAPPGPATQPAGGP